jgi:TolA-binding protein
MDEQSIIGENGEKLSGHEAEAYTLDASKRKEDAQVERDLLAAMTGANIEETRGRQNRGRAQKGEDDRRRKDKEEFDNALRAALQQLRERLERINEEIAELNRKLRELEKDAAELAWARIKLENGESLETVLRDKEILRKLGSRLIA